MAEALYRKYRPQVFSDVVGQEPIERTLRNALKQNKISHAYLFCGPRGTGKTTTARLLAKALLCEQGPTPEPDGTCEDCRMIADGVHPDVYELDAASRTGVENMREEVIGRVQFAPTRGRTKVYIIDEVHMLSLAAFNALLKTLEEPPDHVVFILCTTDPQKVPETVHSRCQRFDFRRIAPESMVARLGAVCVAENVEFEGEALDLIAHRADGGLRNALTSLEQIIAFEGGKCTLAGAERLLGSIDSTDLAEIMAYVGKRDIANCLRWTAEYIETGSDLAQFVRDLAEHVRDLYVMTLVGEDVELDVSETMRRQLVSEMQWFGADRLTRCMGVLGDLMVELKTSSNPRLSFEIALTRLVRPDSDLTIESLAERVEALEAGYSAVAHVLPGDPVIAGAREAVGDVADAVHAAAPSASMMAFARETSHVRESSAGSRDVATFDDPRPASSATLQTAESVAPESRKDEQTAGDAAHAPSAPTTSGVAGGSASALSNPATLQRTWQATMAIVKKQKIAYGALFMNTRITYNGDSDTVEIEFPAESTFAFNAVQKPEARDALATAWERAFGAAGSFVYKLGGAAASASASSPARTVSAQSAPIRQVAQAPAAAASAPQTVEAQQSETPAYRDETAENPIAEPIAVSEPVSEDEFYDDAPLYEDMPPYDDEAGYVDEAPYEQVPYEEIAGAVEVEKDESAPTEAATGDLEALLQAGFGTGVHFEEVDDGQ